MELLHDHAEESSPPVQVILSTHSPHLACAVPVQHLTLVARGKSFSLAPGCTWLDAGDYAFLSRFLDVTKANLFFARAVAIVEGDAEALLLPALALATGRSFGKSGVSVVNVGHTGLFRYSRIFQRSGEQIPVAVACIRDRDLVPKDTPKDMRGELRSSAEMTPAEIAAHVTVLKAGESANVQTFVSDHWTLEYDLAAASWPLATVMHRAVQCARVSERSWPSADKLAEVERRAEDDITTWKSEGVSLSEVGLRVYRPLRMKNASKAIAAQHAARLLKDVSLPDGELPPYLRDAFSHLCGGA
ncbi:hypothetical protein GCM10010094_63800 [Streptomyces flaveus]|uniref:OLD protein-like TOPRIM domain-containing protein n=2 Tax=Streptomyces flaveus TaxID=66370 RepID=A0A917R7U7_9ACTN|nr:hypothetical protein GCM10010094_63800 [Streptomyces flaveus]